MQVYHPYRVIGVGRVVLGAMPQVMMFQAFSLRSRQYYRFSEIEEKEGLLEVSA